MIRPEDVESKSDLVQFVTELSLEERRTNSSFNNCDLGSFLDAMAAWISDMDDYYSNIGVNKLEDSPWRMFSEILMASTMYE
ncbi:MAG: hypothetical protein Pars93KO_27730 [Parasphingorhabdus sp.]